MADARVAKRYARALFEVAVKTDTITAIESDLAGVAYLARNDVRFAGFLESPYVNRDDKLALFDKLFADRVTALTMRALRLLLDKRREGEIGGIYDEFVALRRDHEGIVYAKVTSAIEMDASQRTRLIAKLESILGKKVEAEYHVDPSLIGGVCVDYSNFVLDGSLRGALGKLREMIRYDLLMQA